MNNKRWMALALGAIILVLSWFAPRIDKEEELISKYGKNYNPLASLLDDSPRIEEVIQGSDSANRIAVAELSGTIMTNGVYGPGYTHEDFLENLRDISEDESIKGLLLVVNSPGGGVFESEEIRKELVNIQQRMPIYVSMRNMAASGGYYISAGRDKIYAYDDTITGSIGVIYSGLDLEGLYNKFGIKQIEYTSGKQKRGNHNDEETQKIFQDFVDETYGRFLDIVAEGRDMDMAKLKKLADGRIYTANQAVENGLIDEIGTQEDALAALIEETALTDPEVFHYVYPMKTSLPSFLTMSSKTELDDIKELLTNPKVTSPRALYLYGGE